PLADGPVGHRRGVLGIVAVVEYAAGALFFARLGIGAGERIPNLNLRRAAQVDSAIALGLDLPIDIEFEIAIVLGGAKILTFAVENDDAVLCLPVLVGRLVPELLRRRRLFRRRLQPLGHGHRGVTAGLLGILLKRNSFP